jgi:hypothetical protein
MIDPGSPIREGRGVVAVSETVLSEFVAEPDLAAQLGVTVRTLRGWSRKRVGPPRTVVARRIYYRRAAVEQWLLAREQQPVRSGRRAQAGR